MKNKIYIDPDIILSNTKALLKRHAAVLLVCIIFVLTTSTAVTIGVAAAQREVTSDTPRDTCSSEQADGDAGENVEHCTKSTAKRKPSEAVSSDGEFEMSPRKLEKFEDVFVSETEEKEPVEEQPIYEPQWASPVAHLHSFPASDGATSPIVEKAAEYLGYPYVWGGSTPESSFDCSGYVSWAVNNSGEGINLGRMNTSSLYSVCSPVTADDLRPGDLVFFSGTYGVSGISHVGIYAGGGTMLHCGNYVEYASLSTGYWQEHLFSFGRLPGQ